MMDERALVLPFTLSLSLLHQRGSILQTVLLAPPLPPYFFPVTSSHLDFSLLFLLVQLPLFRFCSFSLTRSSEGPCM